MLAAGEYLGEGFYRAGGVPAVVNELLKAGKIRKNALTVNGKTLAEDCRHTPILDEKVIRPYKHPLKEGTYEIEAVRTGTALELACRQHPTTEWNGLILCSFAEAANAL